MNKRNAKRRSWRSAWQRCRRRRSARASSMYKMQEKVAAARRRERADLKKAGGAADVAKAKAERHTELQQELNALALREQEADGAAELEAIREERVKVLRRQRLL